MLYLAEVSIIQIISVSLQTSPNVSHPDVDRQPAIHSFHFDLQSTKHIFLIFGAKAALPENMTARTLYISQSLICLSQPAGLTDHHRRRRMRRWRLGEGVIRREAAGGVVCFPDFRVCVGVRSLTLKCFPAGDSSFSQTPA